MTILRKFICLFLMTTPFFISAQDTIFTKKGDTICCKITKIDQSNIYFNILCFNSDKSMLLSLNNVANYNTSNPIEYNVPKNKYQKIRLSFDGGLGFRTKKIDEDSPQLIKDFYTKLKSGYQYGFWAQYFLSKNLGIGLKYNHFQSQNAIHYYVQYNSWQQAEYVQNEEINIDFIGPSFGIRGMHNKNRNSFMTYMGIGYLHFLDRVLSSGINATASTYGLAVGINYDIKIAENLAIGLDVSYIMGTLSKIKISDGINTETSTLEHNDNLHHLDISIGLRLIK